MHCVCAKLKMHTQIQLQIQIHCITDWNTDKEQSCKPVRQFTMRSTCTASILLSGFQTLNGHLQPRAICSLKQAGEMPKQINQCTRVSLLARQSIRDPHSLKTLPEAQRTQGIESITWIMFLTEISLKLFWLKKITQVTDSIPWVRCASGNVS